MTETDRLQKKIAFLKEQEAIAGDPARRVAYRRAISQAQHALESRELAAHPIDGVVPESDFRALSTDALRRQIDLAMPICLGDHAKEVQDHARRTVTICTGILKDRGEV